MNKKIRNDLLIYFSLSKILAKSGEPLEEEKEAFDDPEKGKLAEEPIKATPDKKPAETTETKKPETEDNKEEKKSNGAHTPV